MTEKIDTQVQEQTTVVTPTTGQVVRRTNVVTQVAADKTGVKDYQTKKAIFRTYQIIWYILGVIEVLLAFRIVLKFLGANSYSGFTSFIYTLSSPFSVPFAGILGVTGFEAMIFEWSTFIAMIVYAIIAYGVVALFQIVKPTNPEEVDQTIDNQ